MFGSVKRKDITVFLGHFCMLVLITDGKNGCLNKIICGSTHYVLASVLSRTSTIFLDSSKTAVCLTPPFMGHAEGNNLLLHKELMGLACIAKSTSILQGEKLEEIPEFLANRREGQELSVRVEG